MKAFVFVSFQNCWTLCLKEDNLKNVSTVPQYNEDQLSEVLNNMVPKTINIVFCVQQKKKVVQVWNEM